MSNQGVDRTQEFVRKPHSPSSWTLTTFSDNYFGGESVWSFWENPLHEKRVPLLSRSNTGPPLFLISQVDRTKVGWEPADRRVCPCSQSLKSCLLVSSSKPSLGRQNFIWPVNSGQELELTWFGLSYQTSHLLRPNFCKRTMPRRLEAVLLVFLEHLVAARPWGPFQKCTDPLHIWWSKV